MDASFRRRHRQWKSSTVARWLAAGLVVSSLLAGCGGGDAGNEAGKREGNGDSVNADGNGSTSTTEDHEGEIVATAANYELLANVDQRFITGLVVNGEGTVVSFGDVHLQFLYLGTRAKPIDPPLSKFTTTATFMPLVGAQLPPNETQPRIVKPSEGVGVYRAEKVRFDAAGYWGVRVSVRVDGNTVKADTAFEVRDAPQVPAPGQPAPRTKNDTVGTVGEHDAMLDSRAEPGKALVDADLHQASIDAAIAAGKPVMVVVSTPVYCVSRFCGPVTDAVQALAGRYRARGVEFVHLEVWKDFEKKQLNPAAAEWIQLPTGDANEPWVFTIGRDGKIVDRFDNVVSDAELERAVERIAGPASGA